MPVFTVLKKDTSLRLILDCRILNGLCKKPPAMHIPSIFDVLDYCMEHRFAAEADAKSWFFQFAQSLSVGRHFGCHLRGFRGTYVESHIFVRMVMGWSWAPALAQRTSNVLVRDLGYCWVDNFVVAGHSEEECNRKITELRKRFETANVKFADENLRPQTRIELLGMDLDLETKRYKMKDAWLQKLQEKQVRPKMSLREIYEVVGSLLWQGYVRRIPLAKHHQVLALMRDAAKVAHASVEVAWDTVYNIPPEQLSAVENLKSEALEQPWTHWIPRIPPTHEVWADASDTQAAFIVIDLLRDLVIGGHCWDVNKDTHIFLKEVEASTSGIRWCSRHEIKSCSLCGDNTAAVYCIAKGHSTVERANDMIAAVYDTGTQYLSTWVSTHKQLADMFTRGIKPPTFPFPASLMRTAQERWTMLTDEMKLRARWEDLVPQAMNRA
jgi:hypothetical protein